MCHALSRAKSKSDMVSEPIVAFHMTVVGIFLDDVSMMHIDMLLQGLQ